MNAYDFGGRVALVTGGASGIGAATAGLLRTCGARVAVFDLNPNGLHEGVLGISGDVSESADVEAAVERLRQDLASGEWERRYAEILDRDALDLGYRLVVAE